MKDLPTYQELEDPKPINQFHERLLMQIDTSASTEKTWNQPPKEVKRPVYDWELQF